MDYQILMGTDLAKQMDKAIEEMVWFMKNPILNQPAQKWYRGYGIYRVIEPFLGFQTGDNVLLDSCTHYKMVKLATPLYPQVFIDWSKEMSAGRKFTPHEWETHFRELTTKEIYDLFPHMSTRIRDMVGYRLWSKSLPEYMCTECQSKLPVEFIEGHEKHKLQRRCNVCGKNKAIVAPRNSFKPKGR